MRNLRFLALGLLFVLYGSAQPKPTGPLSLSFEENRGQGPVDARFLARGPRYNIAFTPAGNHVVLRHAARGFLVNTQFVDASPNPVIRGEQRQAGKVNYIRRARSLTDIPTYARVRYEGVYPGIDLIYYGNQQQLEYDFVVQPGADPKRIAFRFDGIDSLSVDAEGNLILRNGPSEIVQQKPVVYQRVRGVRKEIQGEYRVLASNTVAFNVGAYDRKTTLVIDPILSYSTFLGGSDGDDDARGVATDSSGNVYITGATTSTTFQTAFPLQPNAGTQDPSAGLSDAFVTKLNPAGTALIYSTYFGGSGDDNANAIAVDASGNVVIVGSTASIDFPATQGAFRRICNLGPGGCLDAFVAEFSSTGSALLFSTYLGGTGNDEALGVAVDSAGNAYVTGRTDSPDFATTPLAYSTDPNAGGFVTKMTSSGTILYSTYFGSFFGPTDPRGIAVDSSGNAYITGAITVSGGTGQDAFITKLNPLGTAILYTQALRGAKDDIATSVTVDSKGNAYIAGQTSSLNFPTTINAVQPTFGGGPAFRSADGGSTWTASLSGLTRTSLYALAVAPGSPSAIYVGADDENAGGVFKSVDGGASWTAAASGISDPRIHALAVDPATPDTVYAGSRTVGVLKTTNGGTNWTGTPLNNVFVTTLAIDPNAPATLYAGTDSNGIYKSVNSGSSWFPVNAGLVTSPVRSIAIDPNSSSTLYVATGVGVYKSTNAGVSWSSSSTGLFDPDINALVLDARTPNLIYAGTDSVGIFKSTNGGGVWVPANTGLTSPSSGISVTAMTIDPSSGTLYASAGDGSAPRVYKSTTGTNWTATGLATARITALAVDRSSAGSVYAATVGGSDAFVLKLNASGSMVYSTYLGGYNDDIANAIAVDSSGGIYVAGSTSSSNFPSLNAVQATFGGGSGVISDAFAAKINSTGELGFSTYLGGSSDDFGKGIAVDASNTAYVVGVTASSDFPTMAALNATRPGLLDAFIVKLGEGAAVAFAVPTRGGFSATSPGVAPSTSVGYARIQVTSGGPAPSGLAIFGFRQNNILVSEAAVPATAAITTGRIYAEVSGSVNTGIAIANPNPTPANVTFNFTDLNGQDFGAGTFTVPASGQIANFLDQVPFRGSAPVSGSFTFSSSQPVAVVALRGLTNERGEFLITTLPVADLAASPSTDPILFPHFADGGGWTTQILLVNTSDTLMSGSVQFGGSASQPYSIPPRSSVKIATAGTASGVLTGSARLTPAGGSTTPSGVAVFSYKNNGITVTEAGVPALRSGTAFRLYAESSGTPGQAGSIQTGIAIANPSSNSINVTFELTTITGVTTGLVSTTVLPGNGQTSMFLGQIPGFSGVPNPFQGVLRVSTTSPSGISVVGLRGRYNERQDFLITTTQPTNEAAPVSTGDLFFPHFADGGGYTTQFILFNGSTDQSAAGLIRFFSQTGQVLTIGVR